ncbi:MAG: hypothetical protein N0E59_02165 [Candidatus Thiodiazotropha taylori]|nr:hypothetical protein [Candidatus Thiodiazotropha taylori]MCG8051911.1 hypothetical protein [Candidatus Thiodiazotropha taylori]MCG8108683.1 hypothetical protein [Candidatus Thiodiazotropha taylori]MCG8109547.1 hypothetical protein [Candidatus Thiodiazotropha taylori]MCW4281019.1 hypothetical protein [Candidatus Thiodiazotropha taylori]
MPGKAQGESIEWIDRLIDELSQDEPGAQRPLQDKRAADAQEQEQEQEQNSN